MASAHPILGWKCARPRWQRRMMSFSLWPVACRGIPTLAGSGHHNVGGHSQAVLGRKQVLFARSDLRFYPQILLWRHFSHVVAYSGGLPAPRLRQASKRSTHTENNCIKGLILGAGGDMGFRQHGQKMFEFLLRSASPPATSPHADDSIAARRNRFARSLA